MHESSDPNVVVRTGQIVSAALAMGVLMFAGVALTTVGDQKPAGDASMAYIAAGFAAVAVMMSMIVPRIVSAAALANLPPRSHANPSDEARLRTIYGAFQTRNIVGAAMLEGA